MDEEYNPHVWKHDLRAMTEMLNGNYSIIPHRSEDCKQCKKAFKLCDRALETAFQASGGNPDWHVEEPP